MNHKTNSREGLIFVHKNDSHKDLEAQHKTMNLFGNKMYVGFSSVE